MTEQRKKKPLAKLVGISPEAYERLANQAFNARPRMTLREYINVLLKLPKEL